MGVIILRLEGPMQSWGTYSHFTERDTGIEPSKSGVIGILCAALGRPRNANLEDLCSLRMTVLTVREGKIARDFHTTLNVPKANNPNRKDTVISNRYYLADACFLVFLEGDDALVNELLRALKNPKWGIYLGRKSFIPSAPVLFEDKIWSGGVEPVVEFALEKLNLKDKKKVRIIIESSSGDGEPRWDVPLSFAKRQFKVRYVRNEWRYLCEGKVNK
ncbi:MAG: type I-E CRISPR-associated protein Cas5/CasD [Methanomassiliicoccales archaeon]|nr:MAG: type I-E CRISPR-associated protein Cas5/CasD [Methanomassiliicoccales archaeon]